MNGANSTDYDVLLSNLAETFPLRSERRVKLLATRLRKMQAIPDDVSRTVERVTQTREMDSFPPPAAFFRLFHEVRSERLREEQLRYERAQRMAQRPMTPEEVHLCRGILALGRRGLYWCPQRERFVPDAKSSEVLIREAMAQHGLSESAATRHVLTMRASTPTQDAVDAALAGNGGGGKPLSEAFDDALGDLFD